MSRSDANRPSVDARTWPGIAMCSAMQMILLIDELPGIGEDFEAAGRVIPSSLADSIHVLLLASVPSALTQLCLLQGKSDLEPEAFLDWIEALDAAAISTRAGSLDPKKEHDPYETLQSPPSSLAESPGTWLRSRASETQLKRVRQLLANPAALKSLAVDVFRALWTNHFEEVYVRHSDAMARAVSQIRNHEQINSPLPLLKQLLGRPIQLDENWINTRKQILLVPFPFMGPYLMSMSSEEPEPMALFAFDARRATGLQAQEGGGPDISKLKALADETRLRILRFVGESERFGGEIVTYLQISQPGVSRHLRLLTASGLLSVRQEGTSKFYSICDEEINALAEGIRKMKSNSKGHTKESA